MIWHKYDSGPWHNGKISSRYITSEMVWSTVVDPSSWNVIYNGIPYATLYIYTYIIMKENFPSLQAKSVVAVHLLKLCSCFHTRHGKKQVDSKLQAIPPPIILRDSLHLHEIGCKNQDYFWCCPWMDTVMGLLPTHSWTLPNSILNSSIWPIDRALSGASTLVQNGPGNDSNEGVLHIAQSSSITGTLPSDCSVLYTGHS